MGVIADGMACPFRAASSLRRQAAQADADASQLARGAFAAARFPCHRRPPHLSPSSRRRLAVAGAAGVAGRAGLVALLSGVALQQVAVCFTSVFAALASAQGGVNASLRAPPRHWGCRRTSSAGGLVVAAAETLGMHGERSRGVAREAVAHEALQTRPTLDLVRKQGIAGFAMKELGQQLQRAEFEATALDGRAHVVFDGLQRLRKVDLPSDVVGVAGDSRDALAEALLGALQKAHDRSLEGTSSDVWQLYQSEAALVQAPLNQIGVGNTADDQWANITNDEATVKLATEVFEKFDADGDGYWNLNETSAVQWATEGTQMAEDAYNALLIASAPDGGRKLTEEDLVKGLSKEQVIELYTDAKRQQKLGFVLDVHKDHSIIFSKEKADEKKEPAAFAD